VLYRADWVFGQRSWTFPDSVTRTNTAGFSDGWCPFCYQHV
jgi:hypothetical protein